MRVIIDWDEKYPELFLSFPGDPGCTEAERDKHGIEVPDEVAARWRAVRDAWHALDEEARRYTGRQP